MHLSDVQLTVVRLATWLQFKLPTEGGAVLLLLLLLLLVVVVVPLLLTLSGRCWPADSPGTIALLRCGQTRD